MDNKLPRLFQPGVRLYFTVLIVFTVATFFIGGHNRILAGVEAVVICGVAVYSRIAAKKRMEKLVDYLGSMSEGMDLTVRDTPLPVMVYSSETGEIVWGNEMFTAITGLRDPFFELNISDVVPGYSGDWLLDGKGQCAEPVGVGERKFMVFGSLTRTGRDYLATTYWVDVTAYVKVSEQYLESRPVFALLTLDNYEDLFKGISEKEKSSILADIDDKIRHWADESDGYLCRFDRDRYFFLTEERRLESFVKDKFLILDMVREHAGAGGVHATLSIGIGKDGSTPKENYRNASLGLEMALSRGGDQAVIRNRYGFEFFGGHSAQPEKRTKVKVRIMASAFGELLGDASTVYIMGHKAADFDSIGSAAGICCIARAKGKRARIVIDRKSNLAENLVELLSRSIEYHDVFVSEQDAILEADSKSLLVVVDTSRPDKVESKTLLLSCTRVAVIDHHRRAAEYIENAALSFHEPYSSSTAELVAEMMQYLLELQNITKHEAEALLAGIVLDTKGFVINTGTRTFDAASFLRRAGADAAAVKRLLQSDMDIASAKFAIMQGVKMYREGVALAVSDASYNRISIAQAADELLSIEGVGTSFAVAREDDVVYVSGRSIGGMNVQVVLEKLGGGGNHSTAGLQIPGGDVERVAEDLKRAVDWYLK